MKWVYIEDISACDDQDVEIRGWVYNTRSSGKIRFLLVRDGTGMIQCTAYSDKKNDPLFKKIDSLTQESSLTIQGKVRKDDRAPGGYEVSIHDIRIIQIADAYPITPKDHGIPFLMEHRHLWLRSKKQNAVLRIRAELIRGIRDYFDSKGFRNLDTPLLTPSACEGTTTLFETEYFDQKAFLSQSGQLYNEATAAAFGKVYCFGPAFRAEKSKTRKHLIEFWMVEPEIAFAELEDVILLSEDLIVSLLDRILDRCRTELDVLERDIKPLESIKLPFPRVTYDDAVKKLNDKGSQLKWGEDFGAPEETLLSEIYKDPVCVTHFPASIKAFYMQPDEVRPDLVLGFDVFAPEGFGELIGGGQRIHDAALLEQRIKEHKLPREPYEWYVDLRKYGSCPHSGFGLGLERTLAWICKLKHIRESIPFPRLLYRIYP